MCSTRDFFVLFGFCFFEIEYNCMIQLYNSKKKKLYSFGCPGTYFLYRADLELREIYLPLLPEGLAQVLFVIFLSQPGWQEKSLTSGLSGWCGAETNREGMVSNHSDISSWFLFDRQRPALSFHCCCFSPTIPVRGPQLRLRWQLSYRPHEADSNCDSCTLTHRGSEAGAASLLFRRWFRVQFPLLLGAFCPFGDIE